MMQYGNELTDEIFSSICLKFDINPLKTTRVRNSLNTLFTFSRGFNTCFLRITSSKYQDFNQITAETDWINFLLKNGVLLAALIPSANNNYIEKESYGDGYFSAVCFEHVKAEGLRSYDWNETLFKKLGKITGRMHALAKEYVPNSAFKRLDYLSVERVNRIINCLKNDAEHHQVIDCFIKATEQINTLDKNISSFGITHNDLTRGNYFLKNNELILIDFEESAYNYFAFDIAVQVFDALNNFPAYSPLQRDSYLNYYLINYFKGYETENKITSDNFNYIPQMITIFASYMYAHPHFLKGKENFSEDDIRYVKNTKQLILEGFDFILPSFFR